MPLKLNLNADKKKYAFVTIPMLPHYTPANRERKFDG
jgi:hypothetical protein